MKSFKANKITISDKALEHLNEIMELVRKDYTHVKSNASLLTSSIIEYFAGEFSEKHLEFLGQKLFNKSAYMKNFNSSEVSTSKIVRGIFKHTDEELVIDKKYKGRVKFITIPTKNQDKNE